MEPLEIALTIVGIIVAIISAWFAWKGLKKDEPTELEVEQSQTQTQEQTVNIIIPPATQAPEKKTEQKKTKEKKVKKEEKVEEKPLKKFEEILMDEDIEAPSGGHARISEDFQAGDTLEGFLEENDNYDFDYYLLDLSNYIKYKNDERFSYLSRGRNKANYHINVEIPETGEWWLILDAYGKQYNRDVYVRLVKKGVR